MEIEKMINAICIDIINIDFLTSHELKNVHFFSEKINIAPRDIVVLLMEIEKRLNFKFSNDFIKEGGIKSFQTIVDYINMDL